MSWLHIDATFGLSGDMMLSSLIDLGVDVDRLAEALASFITEPFALRTEVVQQRGIRSTHLLVECAEGHHHRTAADLVAMVQSSPLVLRAQERSLAIINALANAEARVHGIEASQVAFHEVGAIDSIIDMIGTAIALEWLDIEGLTFSPPALGHGTVRCQHGLYPIPAPATAYLLEGIAIADFDAPGELITPTGAAILSALAERVEPFAGASMQRIGYGAGTRVYADHPNVVRAILFEPRQRTVANHEQDEQVDQVSILSANIDDLPAEVLSHASQRLLDAGALDVWMDPVIMKKGRPGVVLNTLTTPDREEALTALYFEETSTLGVRVAGPFRRRSLARSRQDLNLGYGRVTIKIARYRGKVVQVSPEYETVAALSQASGRSAKAIYQDVAAHVPPA